MTDDEFHNLIKLAKAAEVKQGEDDYWYCPSALFSELDNPEDAYFVSACDPKRIIAIAEELLRSRCDADIHVLGPDKSWPCRRCGCEG